MEASSPEETPAELSPAESRIYDAARALAAQRGRPCCVLLGVQISRAMAVHARTSLSEIPGDDLDVILGSHGGDMEAAYLLVRTWRSRFRRLAVFVPLCAKSAATGVCLGADELVLGEMGELGPLDAQSDESHAADARRPLSCLTSTRVLRELGEHVLTIFDEGQRKIAEATGARALDAAGVAAVLATRLLAPVYRRVGPIDLADDARALELSADYAHRIFRRWRPEIPEDAASTIVTRLVYGYASHGFVIDRPELSELGLPCRAPTEKEAPHVEAIAETLIECEEQVSIRTVFNPKCAETIPQAGNSEAAPGQNDRTNEVEPWPSPVLPS